jgi:hypothetical protein
LSVVKLIQQNFTARPLKMLSPAWTIRLFYSVSQTDRCKLYPSIYMDPTLESLLTPPFSSLTICTPTANMSLLSKSTQNLTLFTTPTVLPGRSYLIIPSCQTVSQCGTFLLTYLTFSTYFVLSVFCGRHAETFILIQFAFRWILMILHTFSYQPFEYLHLWRSCLNFLLTFQYCIFCLLI